MGDEFSLPTSRRSVGSWLRISAAALCHLDRSHTGLAQEALKLLEQRMIEVQRDPHFSQDDREQLGHIWSEFRRKVLIGWRFVKNKL